MDDAWEKFSRGQLAQGGKHPLAPLNVPSVGPYLLAGTPIDNSLTSRVPWMGYKASVAVLLVCNTAGIYVWSHLSLTHLLKTLALPAML